MRQQAVIRIIVAMLFLAVFAFAQRDLGTIAGAVTDPQGYARMASDIPNVVSSDAVAGHRTILTELGYAGQAEFARTSEFSWPPAQGAAIFVKTFPCRPGYGVGRRGRSTHLFTPPSALGVGGGV
jgi:hypothetical protein